MDAKSMLIGMAVLGLLYFVWFPGWEKQMTAQADAQLDKGDVGGCLGTSIGFLAVCAALIFVALLGLGINEGTLVLP